MSTPVASPLTPDSAPTLHDARPRPERDQDAPLWRILRLSPRSNGRGGRRGLHPLLGSINLLTLCEGGLVFRPEGSAGRTAGLAIGVVLALAACSSAPADDPETTAQRFLRALAGNDLDKACLLMADGVHFGIQDLPECNNLLGAVAAEPDNQLAKYAHAKVRSAAVQGDQARVTKADISNVENPDVGLSLQRIDGRWYVSELG